MTDDLSGKMDSAILLNCRLLNEKDISKMTEKHPMFAVINALDSALCAGASVDRAGYTSYALEKGEKSVIFNGKNSCFLYSHIPSMKNYGINYISTFFIPPAFCNGLIKKYGSLNNALGNINNLDEVFKCPTKLEKVYDKNGKFMWYTLEVANITAPANKATISEQKSIRAAQAALTGNHYCGRFLSYDISPKFNNLDEMAINDQNYVLSSTVASSSSVKFFSDGTQIRNKKNKILHVKPVKFRIADFDEKNHTLALTLDSANNSGIPYRHNVLNYRNNKSVEIDCEPLKIYVETIVPMTIFSEYLSHEHLRNLTPDNFTPEA